MRENKFRVLIKHPFKALQRIANFESIKSIDFTEQSVSIEVDGEIYKFHFSEVEFINYTGLNDKNGREIYEGDIVRETYDGVCDDEEVVFKDGSFNVRFNHGEELLIGCDSKETEIIGNIYEHSHLLEGLQNGTK